MACLLGGVVQQHDLVGALLQHEPEDQCRNVPRVLAAGIRRRRFSRLQGAQMRVHVVRPVLRVRAVDLVDGDRLPALDTPATPERILNCLVDES